MMNKFIEFLLVWAVLYIAVLVTVPLFLKTPAPLASATCTYMNRGTTANCEITFDNQKYYFVEGRKK